MGSHQPSSLVQSVSENSCQVNWWDSAFFDKYKARSQRIPNVHIQLEPEQEEVVERGRVGSEEALP